jgi:hypothetical protein
MGKVPLSKLGKFNGMILRAAQKNAALCEFPHSPEGKSRREKHGDGIICVHDRRVLKRA